MRPKNIADWTTNDVISWLTQHGHGDPLVVSKFREHQIDGKALLTLREEDLKTMSLYTIGVIKRLNISIRQLQKDNLQLLLELGYLDLLPTHNFFNTKHNDITFSGGANDGSMDHEFYSASISEDGTASHLPPEIWKAFISLGYLFIVTWITAFVMVIVHDRVPDMKKYPPLPDIFLDNVPHIPWAFDMCEVTGTLLFAIWLLVLIFHKYRFILLRRFFALSGTVFLLRCVTMLITSLSVPGAHLQCQPRNNPAIDSSISLYNELYNKIELAYVIWRGAGMSIQGVRTCGDYMFSGHTVALTMLNFFITEYTPRQFYFIHTFTWMLNMFGIFFILAAHEHYSIDVFVAFYITSRLFLYYHTLANNQALMQRDSNRTRVWFPLFSFFESSVDGIVPNEYETPSKIVCNMINTIKDTGNYLRSCFLTTKTHEKLNGDVNTTKKKL
ncbi:hypothetical protein QAD02_016094 [Eretmocerus hayati]|uniref:Uncharacterized protein n=1 Tax=Eretmocerus hayati TaxID=131215 RepID=A0ACC2PD06_9HYME|nr:hypothetical protein QAD02_016094 [Eretmocerus hayati]